MIPNILLLIFCYGCFFVLVVAKPIQDLSAVSITHKTVGIRLPRLWVANKAPDKFHSVQSSMH
jgi:hypothetical protein